MINDPGLSIFLKKYERKKIFDRQKKRRAFFRYSTIIAVINPRVASRHLFSRALVKISYLFVFPEDKDWNNWDGWDF